MNERARDVQVERTLRNVVCEGFDDSVILPPGAVMTGNHEMYKVFTPFQNALAETAAGRDAGVRRCTKSS